MKKIKITWKLFFIAVGVCVAAILLLLAVLSREGKSNDLLKDQVITAEGKIETLNKSIAGSQAEVSKLEVDYVNLQNKYNTDKADYDKKVLKLTGELKSFQNLSDVDKTPAKYDELLDAHTEAIDALDEPKILEKECQALIKNLQAQLYLKDTIVMRKDAIISEKDIIINTWEIAYKKKARRNLKSKIINGIIFTAAGFLTASILK